MCKVIAVANQKGGWNDPGGTGGDHFYPEAHHIEL